MLLEEFLIPMELTQRQLADEIHVPYQRVNELTNVKPLRHPSTVLRLAKIFGTSSEFWLNLQMRWDVTFAQQASTVFGSTINGASASNGMMATRVTWKLLTTIEGKHEHQ